MTETNAYPLAWPTHKPRTRPVLRNYGRFGRREGYTTKMLTLSQAVSRVQEEIDRFKASSLIISTNYKLRNDGLPRSGQPKPNDPGAAIYFELSGNPRCIPCDQYLSVEDNLAAIAATLVALRTIERHGSQMFESAFNGFTALPGPDHIISRSWRDVLDYHGDDIERAKEKYRKLRSATHTDKGGSTDKFDEVTRAWEAAQNELKKET